MERRRASAARRAGSLGLAHGRRLPRFLLSSHLRPWVRISVSSVILLFSYITYGVYSIWYLLTRPKNNVIIMFSSCQIINTGSVFIISENFFHRIVLLVWIQHYIGCYRLLNIAKAREGLTLSSDPSKKRYIFSEVSEIQSNVPVSSNSHGTLPGSSTLGNHENRVSCLASS